MSLSDALNHLEQAGSEVLAELREVQSLPLKRKCLLWAAQHEIDRAIATLLELNESPVGQTVP